MSGVAVTEPNYNIYIIINLFRYRLYLQNKKYEYYVGQKPSDWIHIAWVIRDQGQGMDIYNNGALKTSHGNITTGRAGGSPSGKVTIGKKYLQVEDHFGSVIVDEVSLWNRKLTAQEIQDIYTIKTSHNALL